MPLRLGPSSAGARVCLFRGLSVSQELIKRKGKGWDEETERARERQSEREREGGKEGRKEGERKREREEVRGGRRRTEL